MKIFDSTARNIFKEVSQQISQIDGKLLSPKLEESKKTQLLALKMELRNQAKELRNQYAATTYQNVINESNSLLTKLKGMNGASFKKVPRGY